MKTIHGIPDEVLKDLMKFQTEKGWSIPMLLCALVVMDAISNGGSLSRAKKRARAIAKGVITRPGFVEKLASLASAPGQPGELMRRCACGDPLTDLRTRLCAPCLAGRVRARELVLPERPDHARIARISESDEIPPGARRPGRSSLRNVRPSGKGRRKPA